MRLCKKVPVMIEREMYSEKSPWTFRYYCKLLYMHSFLLVCLYVDTDLKLSIDTNILIKILDACLKRTGSYKFGFVIVRWLVSE